MTKSVAKQVIAIDVDDVLAHSTESLRQVVNAKMGVSLEPEHYQIPGPYWGYYEKVWEAHGLKDKVSLQELSPQMAEDQSHVPTHTGAASALAKLSEQYRLIVITARHIEWEAATHVWLDSNFPGMFSQIIFGGGRQHNPDVSKGDLCKQAGATYIIDDNPEHCMAAQEKGVTPVLFGQYGWHVDAPADMVRCKTWKDVEEYFERQQG